MDRILFLSLAVFVLLQRCSGQGTPILNWHGLGDYYNSTFMQGYLDIIVANTQPGTYLHSISIGNTWEEDKFHSFFYNVDQMIQEVCDFIANEPELQNGYHGIGWSQGGNFMRGVAERCPDPPMKNLVTMGSQHQGVFGLPHCPPDPGSQCDFAREFVGMFVYNDRIQDMFVPAQFWHDSTDEQTYIEKSGYIADVNNEGPNKNPAYKANLEQLENFVMLKYLQDEWVFPQETSHFEYYVPGDRYEILPLRESAIYLEDWIGLRTLDEAGKLVFYEEDDTHVHSDTDFFAQEIVLKYLQ